MCGLAGFSGHLPADPNKMKILLLENESRGSQSTGIYGKRMMKKNVAASKFISDVNFDHIASARQVIGHTRQPTSSHRDKQHAHPFMFGVKGGDNFIVGAHNGSIFNEYELEKKIEGFTRSDVDSESIFKAMFLSKDPMKFMMCEGHMALTFIHNGLVYLYRRETRPLFLGKTREGYYWSSLKDGLRKLSIPDEKIYDLRPHRLLILDGSKVVDKIEMPKPRVEMEGHHTSYNWDTRLSPELKEELTGKKYYPPVVHTAKEGTNHSEGRQESIKNYSSENTRSTTNSKATTDIPLFRSQTIPSITRTRILSVSDLKKAGMPTLFGRNISIPKETKLTSREYSDFIRDSMKVVDTKPHVYYNFFNGDITAPFWVKDPYSVIVSDTVVFPQACERLESCVTESTVIDICFLFNNKELGTLVSPQRNQLYAFWKLGDSSSNANNKFDLGAVAYAPLNNRKNSDNDGYFRIEIPKHALNELKERSKTFRIAVADVYSPGFFWDTSIRVEEDSYYKLTIVMDVDAEDKFKKGAKTMSLEASNFDGTQGTSVETRIKSIYQNVIELSKKYPYVMTEAQVNAKINRNLFKAGSNLKTYKDSMEEKKRELMSPVTWD